MADLRNHLASRFEGDYEHNCPKCGSDNTLRITQKKYDVPHYVCCECEHTFTVNCSED